MAAYEDFSAEQFVRVSDIIKEPQKMLMPIAGYEDMPLLSLEEAVEPLVPILPRIRDYVYVAKQRCETVPADDLTRDESSSIMLYTMEWEPTDKCLYFAMNATLRSEDRRKLRPWFSYLKLILTALSRLPSNRCSVYRGVKMDISEQYPKDKTFIWWAFSSSTSSIEILKKPQFLGETGARTLFTIDCDSGKDISRHSFYQSEKEILLLPARQFIVKACFQPAPDLHLIQLEEVEAPICLLQPVVIDSKSNKSSSTLSDKPVSSRMRRRIEQQKQSMLKANPHCPRDREINILLLGQSGVGKSTFINAFANYIVNDTLEQAVNDEIQVIIPASFAFTDSETFDQRMVVIGKEDKYEQFSDIGRSNTQQCRSFVFPIGDRNLRFIDTPGIADTRGFEQDAKNFQEILNYIAQYAHLNAVFIMLKPNEERLTVLFQFAVNELLRHLHVGVKDNLVFVFTNARSTFFMPGPTKKILKGLLTKNREEHNVEVPFSEENTFFLDNEPFRYLALYKNGIGIDKEQTQNYVRSWDHSVKEYTRFTEHSVKVPPYAVSSTRSLNEAEQLLRILARPIAETTKLIEQNIQLATRYKEMVLNDPEIASEGIPQNDPEVTPLEHPRTVCVGENCCRVIEVGKEKEMEYLYICHDKCYLKGVKQETLYDPKLQDCTSMDPYSGFCTVCDCHWLQHKHITYEYNPKRTHIQSNTTASLLANQEMMLVNIDKRIIDLREEAAEIQDVYRKLAAFLHANAMLPINDDILEYLQYFIREEQMKQSAGAHNTEVITGLQNITTKLEQEMALLKTTLHDQKNLGNKTNIPQPDEIFTLVGTLYKLPITGRQIREQVEGIKVSQAKYGATRENYIELPGKAATSHFMLQLRDILSAK